MSANGDGASPPLLDVESLVMHYPVPRGLVGTVARRPKGVVHAVEGVTFQVREGEMLALVGESGCGKTTTAQSVLRMVDPTSGAIRFRGQDITRLGARELRPLRREIQMIYQDPYESLDPRFRVRDTVEEPLDVHGLAGCKIGAAPAHPRRSRSGGPDTPRALHRPVPARALGRPAPARRDRG